MRSKAGAAIPAARAAAALTALRRDKPIALVNFVIVVFLLSAAVLFAERDAVVVDDRRPFGLFAIDDRGVLVGRRRLRLAAFVDDALAHLFGRQRRAQFLVQPVDDRPRRAGRRQQAIAQRRVEAGQPRFGERRQLRHQGRVFGGGDRE